MSRAITRAKNKDQHPGIIDLDPEFVASEERRTAKVARDKETAARLKKAKLALAQVELDIEDEDEQRQADDDPFIDARGVKRTNDALEEDDEGPDADDEELDDVDDDQTVDVPPPSKKPKTRASAKTAPPVCSLIFHSLA